MRSSQKNESLPLPLTKASENSSYSLASKKYLETNSRMDIETKMTSKSCISTKSEFIQQVEKEIELIETTSHEIYASKIALNSKFKQVEEELRKKDIKIFDIVTNIRQTVEPLFENVSKILDQNCKLMTKMLEKDVSDKKQTVAMIMNLEANMKNLRQQKEISEKNIAEFICKNCKTSPKTNIEESIYKFKQIIDHKEKTIKLMKLSIANKSKRFNILLFKHLSDKKLSESVLTSVIEKSCFNNDEFNELLTGFKETCQEMKLELRKETDVDGSAIEFNKAKFIKETGITGNQNICFKKIKETTEKINNQALIYEEQNVKIKKLQEDIDLFGASDQEIAKQPSSKGEIAWEFCDSKAIERKKMQENIKNYKSSNEKILSEIRILESETITTYKSIFRNNKVAIKQVKRQFSENDNKSLNKKLNWIFFSCMLSKNEYETHFKNNESFKTLTNFQIIENFLKNGYLKKVKTFDRVKKIDLKNFVFMRDSFDRKKKVKNSAKNGVPLANFKVKFEQFKDQVGVQNFHSIFQNLQMVISEFSLINSNQHVKKILEENNTTIDSRFAETNNNNRPSEKSISNNPFAQIKTIRPTSVNTHINKIYDHIKATIEKVIPIVYKLSSLLKKNDISKTNNGLSSCKEVDLAHIFIQNLSEKLAEGKIDILSIQNKHQEAQKKLKKEVQDISNELNKKKEELQVVIKDKQKAISKLEHFTRSINSLEEQLLFERSKCDILIKKLQVIDENKITANKLEIENKKNLLKNNKNNDYFKINYGSNDNARVYQTDNDDRNKQWSEKSCSENSSKVGNYFELIKKASGLNNRESKSEVRKPMPSLEKEVANSMHKTYDSNEVRMTPRFLNKGFDFTGTNVKKNQESQENLYNIYKKHFSEVPKISKEPKKGVVDCSIVQKLQEKLESLKNVFESAIQVQNSALEGMKDKISVIGAILSKKNLIIEIFRSRSSSVVINLIESSFNLLPQPKLIRTNSKTKEDLVISNLLLKTQNNILEAKIKVLERDSQKFRQSTAKGRLQIIVPDLPQKRESFSKVHPPSNESSTRKLIITEPGISMKSSSQSIDVPSKQRDSYNKHNFEGIKGFKLMNFEKPKNRVVNPEIYETENSFEQETLRQNGAKPNKRESETESNDHVDFSFSIPFKPKSMNKELQNKIQEKAVLEKTSNMNNKELSNNLKKSKNSDSEDGGEGSQILNLYTQMASSHSQNQSNSPFENNLYNARQSESQQEGIQPDLDESFEKLFYRKVIDNFYPESNDELVDPSINK